MALHEIIEELKTNIDSEKHTERGCGALLKQIANILLPIDQGRIEYVDSEQNVSSGRIDLIVYAECSQISGSLKKIAYVWELKAPQLFLFEIDTSSRAKPTEDLYDAENQLLHYHYATANDGNLRETWKIISPHDVKFGGIIMGKSSRYVKEGSLDKEKARKLAGHTFDIRQHLFYKQNEMKLWTWDYLVERAEALTNSFTKKEGDPKVHIDASLNATLPIIGLDAHGTVQP